MTVHDDPEALRLRQDDCAGASAAETQAQFLPPLAIEADQVSERETRLAETIADVVVPRLLALHKDVIVAPPAILLEAGGAEVNELARLVLGPDNSDAADFIIGLRDSGISLDRLHIELLEPAARRLGELWDSDQVDFIDVTIGVARLQRLVHVFEGLDRVAPYDDKRRVLIASAPGDQHSFGNQMVQKFLRAGGWYVYPYATLNAAEVAAAVAKEWFGVVGFSLSADVNLQGIAETVQQVRKASLNRRIGIMVGGAFFAGNPDRVKKVGADGTAANGPAAVVLAKKLLVAGLEQA